jgi:hypothetical protein
MAAGLAALTGVLLAAVTGFRGVAVTRFPEAEGTLNGADLEGTLAREVTTGAGASPEGIVMLGAERIGLLRDMDMVQVEAATTTEIVLITVAADITAVAADTDTVTAAATSDITGIPAITATMIPTTVILM